MPPLPKYGSLAGECSRRTTEFGRIVNPRAPAGRPIDVAFVFRERPVVKGLEFAISIDSSTGRVFPHRLGQFESPPAKESHASMAWTLVPFQEYG